MPRPAIGFAITLLGMSMKTSVILAWTAFCLVGAGAPVAGQGQGQGQGASAPRSDPMFLLPGADPHPVALELEFLDAIEAKGTDYVPRTRHVWENGTPKFTNRLIFESSPYLQQHAHNPVNWYPWGDEAFELARKSRRPVLLSIGYSTCHWCHVMEEESFEDEEIAAYLNANYVAIKVDREERPDIDAVYMSAVQALTGRGGWPMTTWLTPDREVFYGGTYFPPRDGSRGRSTGFLTILKRLRSQYDMDPATVADQAASLTKRIQAQMQPRPGSELPADGMILRAVEQYAGQFDPIHGGLNHSPKFPSSLPNRLLFREYAHTGEERWLDMALLTLRRMARGGMYDQVGGGFHRYSTDKRWLVPHFEKMLYDNALLAVAYVEAYQLTGDEEFAAIAREVLDYVVREMSDPRGGFYSATDADSIGPDGEREEGWYFTWTPEEIRALLGDGAGRVEAYYGVKPGGNFEGRTILNLERSPAEIAVTLGVKPERLAAEIREAKQAMYRARQDRPAPLLDDKVLTSWNGLMISAFAVGGFVLDDADYRARGERAAGFLLDNMIVDGRLRRSYKEGRARHTAYLDDYAFLIQGLLDLYEATGKLRWLEQAIELQATLDRFYADSSGGYFMTANDAAPLLAREKPSYDGAEPSGNSVALFNLLRLHEWTTDDRYRAASEKMLRAFGPRLERSPRAMSEMLLGVDFRRSEPKEVVVVLPEKGGNGKELLDVLRSNFLPGKVLVLVREGDELQRHAERIPLVAHKVARKGKATAYVCNGGVCRLPTSDPEVFLQQLTTRSNEEVPVDDPAETRKK